MLLPLIPYCSSRFQPAILRAEGIQKPQECRSIRQKKSFAVGICMVPENTHIPFRESFTSRNFNLLKGTFPVIFWVCVMFLTILFHYGESQNPVELTDFGQHARLDMFVSI